MELTSTLWLLTHILEQFDIRNRNYGRSNSRESFVEPKLFGELLLKFQRAASHELGDKVHAR